jgi:hypothetical protein
MGGQDSRPTPQESQKSCNGKRRAREHQRQGTLAHPTAF